MRARHPQRDKRTFPVGLPYKRFSNPSQESGDSIRRHNALSVAWSERTGVPLDLTLTLEDRGVSGLRGVSRSDPDRYALAAFLRGIETGRVQPGDFLLIENLDRLSREEEVPATHLLTSILMASVKVVQLSPYEMELTEKSDGWTIMRAVMELSRGHGESRIKSERVAQAKARRREAARAGAVALSGRLPGWIRLGADGKPELIPERAAVVKRIFEMAGRGGHGICSIVARLTRDGTPTFGTRVPLLDEEGRPLLTRTGRPRHRAAPGERMGSGHWTRAYVARILADRRAVGELQPRRRDGTPVGEPVAIPAVVTEWEWMAARAGASQRGQRPGRTSTKVNLFAHLIRDARTGSSYCCSRRNDKRSTSGAKAVLITVDAAEGRTPCVSFPLDTFEEAVLKHLREIDPAQVLLQEEPDDTTWLAAELEEVRAQYKGMETKLAALKASPEVGVPVLLQLRKRSNELDEQLRVAQQKAAHPLSESWDQAQSLLETVRRDPEARLRLRSLLRQIVSEIRLLVVSRGRDRLAAVQIWFTGGTHRDYLILHRPPLCTPSIHRPGHWWARSLASDAIPGELDLRDRDHAARLEAVLAELPLDEPPNDSRDGRKKK
jgi:DNA invertase Pin-like site-specific DNA recombinase